MEPISHFEWYKYFLIDMFGFDFLKGLKKMDEMYPDPDGIDITEGNIEMFIEETSGKDYLKYLKEDKDKYISFVRELFETYMFYKYGKKIFKFEKDLAEMLLRTDLTSVDSSFIKTPFNSFYMAIPESTFTCKIPNSDVEYQVAGVYIYNLDITKYDRLTIIRELGRDIILNLQLLVILIPKNAPEENTWEAEMKAILNLRFKQGNVFEQLEDNYNRVNIEFRELANEIFSFVLNAILYINMDKSLLKVVQGEYKDTKVRVNKNNPRIEAKKETEKKKYSYYHVGKEIVIDTRFKEIVHSGEGRGKKKHSSRWLVRGHWRNQACGKDMSEHKLIWIKPYMKGDNEKEIIEKDYRVK